MRTIEVTGNDGTRARIVIAEITGFSEGEECLYIFVEGSAHPVFTSKESLDSFTARYEAAMDEMERSKELAVVASQIEQALGKPFEPIVIQRFNHRCAACGQYGDHVCTT